MKKTDETAIPEILQEDLRRAVQILKDGGCSEVYLFGSAATGELRERSDLDLAVKGCPQGQFFHLLGKLMMELNSPVDLISLDSGDAFAQFLQKEGELVRIG